MRSLCLVLLLAAACVDPSASRPDSSRPDAPPAAPSTRGESPAADPAAPGAGTATIEEIQERNITIDTVEVGNPLIITGRARTFENNVALRLRDASGDRIAETFTTAVGELGHHNPFRATLWITRPPGDRIIIEALEYSAKDGSEQSLVRVERAFAVEPIEVVLHFTDPECTGVKPFRRRIPKSVSLARLLVEALIAGPTPQERAAGAENPFPRGARVESVNLRDGVLTVDFNEALRNVGGACRAQMIRAAVTETLRALPSVQKVVITAAGSESLALQP